MVVHCWLKLKWLHPRDSDSSGFILLIQTQVVTCCWSKLKWWHPADSNSSYIQVDLKSVSCLLLVRTQVVTSCWIERKWLQSAYSNSSGCILVDLIALCQSHKSSLFCHRGWFRWIWPIDPNFDFDCFKASSNGSNCPWLWCRLDFYVVLTYMFTDCQVTQHAHFCAIQLSQPKWEWHNVIAWNIVLAYLL